MKTIIFILAMGLTGCGWLNRFTSEIVGDGSEVCMHGVLYYQFTSGAAVAYEQDGTVKKCKE